MCVFLLDRRRIHDVRMTPMKTNFFRGIGIRPTTASLCAFYGLPVKVGRQPHPFPAKVRSLSFSYKRRREAAEPVREG